MNDRLAAALAELAEAIREEVAAAAATAPTEPERLLAIDEAARRLSIGRTRLYTEIAEGRVRSLLVGRRRLIPASAIAERIADPRPMTLPP